MIKPNIVVLSKLLEGTGNKTTASRICSPHEFHNFVVNNDIMFIIGLHIFHTGPFLRDCNIPFMIIFGGTDVNCKQSNESVYEEMKQVLLLARYLVAFTVTLKFKALELWPDLKAQDIFILSQGVTTNPCTYTFKQLFLENKKVCDLENKNLFLLAGGLRPVKDQIYLFDSFSEWHQSNPNVYLVIVGPELEVCYSQMCKKKLESCSGIYMFPTIACCCVHALITQSTAVINSSVSEGMSAVLLEAMKLEIPVIARQNDGNNSLITHGENGFLFNTPQEFISQAKLLLYDNNIRRKLASNGKLYVENHHSCKNEELAYCKFLKNEIHLLNQNDLV
ncbi:glycosyltransferase 1 domain-containing protein 1 isoform X2 [Hydra vulgaris]|uniref:glycosyltransferase 1 domain-containing protein 1 isoform X2 n=1 Tax=Hydra vulgaris TaxID=6087 RepID=UPI001F5E5CFE|nr:glycosyltransferase 1 domain-containing protein 1 isoform X2 [Hydra vulgaris]